MGLFSGNRERKENNRQLELRTNATVTEVLAATAAFHSHVLKKFPKLSEIPPSQQSIFVQAITYALLFESVVSVAKAYQSTYKRGRSIPELILDRFKETTRLDPKTHVESVARFVALNDHSPRAGGYWLAAETHKCLGQELDFSKVRDGDWILEFMVEYENGRQNILTGELHRVWEELDEEQLALQGDRGVANWLAIGAGIAGPNKS